MSTIESVLKETRSFPPSDAFRQRAVVSGMDAYNALCDQADQDYTGYWGDLARNHLSWKTPFTRVFDDSNAPFFKWFDDGELNASYNCIDRHLATQGDKVALIFEADNGDVEHITYNDLYSRVCLFANGLKSRGIKKGDRVVLYMPMVVEAIVAMQACARIGAIHSIVFGGFSAKSLQERICDAGAVAVITANEGMRGGKTVPLKATTDEALALGGCESVKTVAVYQRTPNDVSWVEGRDVWWHDLTAGQPADCEPEWMNAEDPLFILYTSGSTGKPKGIQHSTAGYLLGAMNSFDESMPRCHEW